MTRTKWSRAEVSGDLVEGAPRRQETMDRGATDHDGGDLLMTARWSWLDGQDDDVSLAGQEAFEDVRAAPSSSARSQALAAVEKTSVDDAGRDGTASDGLGHGSPFR